MRNFFRKETDMGGSVQIYIALPVAKGFKTFAGWITKVYSECACDCCRLAILNEKPCRGCQNDTTRWFRSWWIRSQDLQVVEIRSWTQTSWRNLEHMFWFIKTKLLLVYTRNKEFSGSVATFLIWYVDSILFIGNGTPNLQSVELGYPSVSPWRT